MNPRDALILEWQQAQTALALAKEAESILRAQVIEAVFCPEPLTEGSQTLELGNGYRLKARFKVNRKFTIDSDSLIDFLANLEASGSEGAKISEEIVRWKGDLSLTHYRQLPAYFRSLFDEIIIANDATPELELITPG